MGQMMKKRFGYSQAVAASRTNDADWAAPPWQQVNWRALIGRALVSVAVSVVFLWLLSLRLSHIDLPQLIEGFGQIGLTHWAIALSLTGLSFAAVGQYDAVIHRHFATGIAAPTARRAGICAIAVSQTLGLGLVTGAILRWRMLPGQSLWAATRMTAVVALSFLAGWAFVTALTLSLLPTAPFQGLAWLGLTCLTLTGVVSLVWPKRPRALPNGFVLLRLIGLTAVDTFAAAAALWVLCPSGLEIEFLTLLPVFLLAFGAGLMSGAPGGVGPFEIALLALLPQTPEPQLLTAVLAWRASYYALPALLGAALALRGPKAEASIVTRLPADHNLLNQSTRAELGLVLQGQHRFLAAGPDIGLLVARSPHLIIALFDPAAPPQRQAITTCLNALKSSAKSMDCSFALYKTSARTAAIARTQGLHCMRIAKEAVLCPSQFRLVTPDRAGLRRKLRHASAAGVTITQPATVRDGSELTALAASWAQTHGGERGFSVGRFCPQYLSNQRVYIAWQNGDPIAFASFHIGSREWTLDLMRYGAGLPDGTMHLLVQAAINDAAQLAVPRLSLAAVPDFNSAPALLRKLTARMTDACAGNARFKKSFAPSWEPLYLIAPNAAGLALAAVEIAREIHHPPPLSAPNRPANEHHYADIEFASDVHTWHRQLN
jgi:phosphatidylglycerol lysyltransferase